MALSDTQPPAAAYASPIPQIARPTRLIRAGAALWIASIVVTNLVFWSRPEAVARAFDVPSVSGPALTAAVLVIAVDIAFAAFVALRIWQLCGLYLEGRVFTADAAAALWPSRWRALWRSAPISWRGSPPGPS